MAHVEPGDAYDELEEETRRMTERPRWQNRTEPLFDRLRELDAVLTWEGYASLNTDKPRQKDVIIRHYYTQGEDGKHRYYVVTIWADGSGWNVFRPVHDGVETQPTLNAIT